MIKKALLLLSICLFTSCVVTKPRDINTIKTTSVAIDSFYKQKNIPNFLIVKDKSSLAKLIEMKNFAPDLVFLFDESGKEINIQVDGKSCGATAPYFVKNYKTLTDLVYRDKKLEDFISLFKYKNGSEIKMDLNKPSVFVTTSLYGEKYKYNKQMLELYNQYKADYNFYVINTDYNTDWAKDWNIEVEGRVHLPVKLL
nr:hypothetical protein [uncultured Flavobacterium sp.]